MSRRGAEIAEKRSEVRTVTDEMPDCPWCGDNRQVYEEGDRNYWCRGCNRSFDAEDDGTIGYGRPDQNAIRREEHELRQRTRKRR